MFLETFSQWYKLVHVFDNIPLTCQKIQHTVWVSGTVLVLFSYYFLKNLNSALSISCHDSASSLSSNYTLNTLGTRSSMIQEAPKSFKSQISQSWNNSNLVVVSSGENENNPCHLSTPWTDRETELFSSHLLNQGISKIPSSSKILFQWISPLLSVYLILLKKC